MSLEKQSPCKVNLLLNILGKRADGFHELETIFHPVNVCDRLEFSRGGSGIHLTCSNPALPTDSTNLVYRAASAFLSSTKINEGIRIHLKKTIPMAAGLGGGSGNAATTLTGLNELFHSPLSDEELHRIAATLGSDVNFFLQSKPALAVGRGEKITSLDFFPALHGKAFVLVHPGFGIATAWAYQQLAQFPETLNGRGGRAQRLISQLQAADARKADLYNSLEAPALKKFPILALYQEFFHENGAFAALMSGSGSTTFAIVENQTIGEKLAEKFKTRFGSAGWMAIVSV